MNRFSIPTYMMPATIAFYSAVFIVGTLIFMNPPRLEPLNEYPIIHNDSIAMVKQTNIFFGDHLLLVNIDTFMLAPTIKEPEVPVNTPSLIMSVDQ
jgi:hypothetical protein